MPHDEPLSVPEPNALRRFLLSVALIGGVVGCFAIAPQETPRQQWNAKKWGPLVPHKTFPGDCSLCHLPDRWDELRPEFHYDHLKETGVKLEGVHERAACLRCHNDRGPVKEYVERGCGGCHVDPHEETLGTECQRCHDSMSWRPTGVLATHAQTRFPLIGAHLAVTCDRCHEQAHVGDFVGAPTECEVCHGDDLASATNPDHVALGYTHDCQRCHSPVAWDATHFAHSTFALTGAHRSAACTDCHVGGVFAGTPRDCFSCHSNDYAGATNPDHATSGFGTSCEQCHNTNAWVPSQFSHTSFPLTGAHRTTTCSACHGNGIYAGTPRDCYSCHSSDYAGATNPDHVSSGFGTSCETCHTTTAWVPSTFDHDAFFPIDSGKHSGITCIECHTTGSNSTFSCIDCHEHTKSKMDSEHSGEPGYVWTSPACYTCHPDGRGD